MKLAPTIAALVLILTPARAGEPFGVAAVTPTPGKPRRRSNRHRGGQNGMPGLIGTRPAELRHRRWELRRRDMPLDGTRPVCMCANPDQLVAWSQSCR